MSTATPQPRLLIFDFDGTLYRGDEPYRYYAQQVGQLLPPDIAQAYLAKVQAHLDGEELVAAADNWEAVVQLMEPFGQTLDPQMWQEAFMATRRYMLEDRCPLVIPEGLSGFLAEARPLATLALASNSPYEAAVPLLRRLNLDASFDVIKTQAGKPAGLVAAAKEIMGAQYDPARVMSIGDHYSNDIAPGVQAGWATGHISPRGVFPGPATFRGTTLEEILPQAKIWLQKAREA